MSLKHEKYEESKRDSLHDSRDYYVFEYVPDLVYEYVFEPPLPNGERVKPVLLRSYRRRWRLRRVTR